MAIERDAVIRVRTQGTQQAEAQLDGVAGGLREVSAGADKAAASTRKTSESTDKAARSFADAGEAMEKSLKPIDSTFKGFDRINGIIGQVTNAANILSGAALIGLGAAFVDIGKKIAGFVTGSEAARQALERQRRAAERAAKAYQDLKSALPEGLFTGDPVQAAQFASERALLVRYEEQYAAALDKSKDAIAGIAALRPEVEAAREALRRAEEADVAAAALGPAGESRRDSPVVARLRARAAALGNELATREAAARDLAALGRTINEQQQVVEDLQRVITGAIDREEAAVERAARDTERRVRIAGPGSSNPAPEVDISGDLLMLEALNAEYAALTAGPDDVSGVGAAGAGPIALAAQMTADVGASMAAASLDSALFAEQLARVESAARNASNAFGTIGGAVGQLQGAMQSAGIDFEGMARVMAGIRAAQLTAEGVSMIATGTATSLGGLFGIGANPLLGGAQIAAGGALLAAAGIHAAQAAGALDVAGGGGGAGGGGVAAAPAPGAFGSATSSSDQGGAVTINVNSPGAAFLSRSERQRLGTELGGMVVTAMGARGSGLRTDFRRELGR